MLKCCFYGLQWIIKQGFNLIDDDDDDDKQIASINMGTKFIF
jgi:hypothetical protein